MNRSPMLGLVVALLLHADWHIARPMHHRWSLGFSYHWLTTAILFAVLGWFVARRWPAERWRLGAQSLFLGLILAQILEPVFVESLYYRHALGYPVEPERWSALGAALVAAVPAYAVTLWLHHPGDPQSRFAFVSARAWISARLNARTARTRRASPHDLWREP